MRRGTTPTHTIQTDMDLTDAEVLYITYRQNGKNVIEKSLHDGIVVMSDSVNVKLSQADTLAFSHRGEVLIQIRAGFADGSRLASNVMHTTVDEILKDGEI